MFPFRGSVALAAAEGCSISAAGVRGGCQPGDCWRVNSRTRAAAADLGNEGLKIVPAQAEVPVGRNARESVCEMAQDSAAFGEDFVARVAGNVVSEEEDVRDVLAKVAIGEADAGIVYVSVSDAAAAGDDVHVIEIPDALNIVASYPIAAVTEGDDALADFGFEPAS
jgi:ABC-type molybdate transport system substrate-binding protein